MVAVMTDLLELKPSLALAAAVIRRAPASNFQYEFCFTTEPEHRPKSDVGLGPIPFGVKIKNMLS
jgi:hypothetical protein